MNTPALPPGNPSDYIAIPKHLRNRPVATLYAPCRVWRWLGCAGIRRLGDLHGKRLSEFRKYRGCASGTLRALGSAIARALEAGVESDLVTWPVPKHWVTLTPRIDVPVAVRRLSLEDLPLSTRLEGALRGLCVKRLGELHGLPLKNLRRMPGHCGAGTLAEFKDLLRRAEAGEFTLSRQVLASRTPGDLLGLIDDLLSRLPKRSRVFLTLHLGAKGNAPWSHRQIGQQHGITGSAAGQYLSRTINRMRREGGLRLRSLLDCVEGVCAKSHTPLSPALVSTWQDPSRPFRYSPQFYVRLIPKLRLQSELSQTHKCRAQQ